MTISTCGRFHKTVLPVIPVHCTCSIRTIENPLCRPYVNVVVSPQCFQNPTVQTQTTKSRATSIHRDPPKTADKISPTTQPQTPPNHKNDTKNLPNADSLPLPAPRNSHKKPHPQRLLPPPRTPPPALPLPRPNTLHNRKSQPSHNTQLRHLHRMLLLGSTGAILTSYFGGRSCFALPGG